MELVLQAQPPQRKRQLPGLQDQCSRHYAEFLRVRAQAEGPHLRRAFLRYGSTVGCPLALGTTWTEQTIRRSSFREAEEAQDSVGLSVLPENRDPRYAFPAVENRGQGFVYEDRDYVEPERRSNAPWSYDN